MNSSFRLYRIILPVTDIEKAKHFYSNLFGMKGISVSPGRLYFDLGGTILAVYDPKADGDPYQTWKYHDNQFIYIAVDHLEPVLENLKILGGEILQPIEKMPWGERLFYAKDPFENRICFVEANSVFTGKSEE